MKPSNRSILVLQWSLTADWLRAFNAAVLSWQGSSVWAVDLWLYPRWSSRNLRSSIVDQSSAFYQLQRQRHDAPAVGWRLRPTLGPVHTSNNVEATGNIVEIRSTLSKQHSTLLPQTATMSNDSIVKMSSFRQSRNKLNVFNLFRLCRKDEISLDSVAENGNNVEATFHIVERIVQFVAFDNVAGTLLLVWTGL